MTAKCISINVAGGKFSGCASEAVKLTPGDLAYVVNFPLREERSDLTVCQKSAEGIVGLFKPCFSVAG